MKNTSGEKRKGGGSCVVYTDLPKRKKVNYFFCNWEPWGKGNTVIRCPLFFFFFLILSSFLYWMDLLFVFFFPEVLWYITTYPCVIAEIFWICKLIMLCNKEFLNSSWYIYRIHPLLTEVWNLEYFLNKFLFYSSGSFYLLTFCATHLFLARWFHHQFYSLKIFHSFHLCFSLFYSLCSHFNALF